MHYYKRNIGDYAKKAGKLSMLQHGAYTLLIDACYDRERFPTIEEAIDWTWAETEQEQEAVKVVLRRFFTLVDGQYVQERITEELAAYREISETNKRIALEREEAKRARSVPKRERYVDEPAPNHKPLTTNQEDILSPENQATTPVCPHLEILELFGKHLPELPQPMPNLWEGARAKALQQRWKWVMANKAKTKEEGLDFFGRYFVYVSKSDFLSGRNGKWTACDLGWLVKADNFTKVMQGNYQNKEEQ